MLGHRRCSMSNGADRSSRSRTELKRGYVVEAQAATLFAFLKQTFFQMPLLVQVTGWLVFLALFVFLVLYPILGITYFQGKIISLADEGGDATTKPEFGMRVYREIPTSTN